MPKIVTHTIGRATIQGSQAYIDEQLGRLATLSRARQIALMDGAAARMAENTPRLLEANRRLAAAAAPTKTGGDDRG